MHVFPAHAGMSRTMAHTYKTDPCFPRPRGDEPMCQVFNIWPA